MQTFEEIGTFIRGLGNRFRYEDGTYHETSEGLEYFSDEETRKRQARYFPITTHGSPY